MAAIPGIDLGPPEDDTNGFDGDEDNLYGEHENEEPTVTNGGGGGEEEDDEENENPLAGDSDSEDEDIQVTIGDVAPTNVVPFVKSGGGGAATAGKLDMDNVPLVEGQTIYDMDLAQMEDRPWRKPGADVNDYFNYGFTEETWNMYCERQKKLRAEFVSQSAVNKALFNGISLSNPLSAVYRQNVPTIGGEINKVLVDNGGNFNAGRYNNYNKDNDKPIMRTVINPVPTPVSISLTPAVPTPVMDFSRPPPGLMGGSSNMPSTPTSVAPAEAPPGVDDAPPGVDDKPPGVDASPGPGSGGPPGTPSRSLPNMGVPPPGIGGVTGVDLCRPPPNFNPNLPPPNLPNLHAPPPGMGSLPPTNMPPPGFNMNMPPPSFNMPPGGYPRYGGTGGPPGVHPPGMGPPGMMGSGEFGGGMGMGERRESVEYPPGMEDDDDQHRRRHRERERRRSRSRSPGAKRSRREREPREGRVERESGRSERDRERGEGERDDRKRRRHRSGSAEGRRKRDDKRERSKREEDGDRKKSRRHDKDDDERKDRDKEKDRKRSRRDDRDRGERGERESRDEESRDGREYREEEREETESSGLGGGNEDGPPGMD